MKTISKNPKIIVKIHKVKNNTMKRKRKNTNKTYGFIKCRLNVTRIVNNQNFTVVHGPLMGKKSTTSTVLST